ncbi:MAG: efflux RND transporter periplasmic adaptor subunit [Candidatus Krumholzibacteriales bacterium]
MPYKRHRKTILKYMASASLLSIAALAMIFSGYCGAEEENGPVPVKTFTASRKDISDRIIFTGTIQPWQRSDIVPAAGGKLDEILIEQGDYVEEQQIIANLDMAPVRIQLNQAEAAVSVAKASLENARTNYNRLLKLKEKGSVSTRDYEQAQLAHESAMAQLRQAEANLEMARYNMDEAVIKAPFAGYITSRNADEGDILSPMPGSPGVATLMDISSVKIEGTVPAEDIKYLDKGDRAVIRVDTYPDTLFEGSVYSLSPAASIQTRSFPLEVSAGNPGGMLKPGFFATVELIVRERKGAVAVPVDALLEASGRDYLFVVEDGAARRREVKPGLREGLFIEISEGLAEGETVILAGKNVVSDGSRVAVEGGKGN